jgi:nitroreductase
VRRYADRPIPDEVLNDVLDVARWTGSSKNTQPWQGVVVRDRARLVDLAKCGQFAPPRGRGGGAESSYG